LSAVIVYFIEKLESIIAIPIDTDVAGRNKWSSNKSLTES